MLARFKMWQASMERKRDSVKETLINTGRQERHVCIVEKNNVI